MTQYVFLLGLDKATIRFNQTKFERNQGDLMIVEGKKFRVEFVGDKSEVNQFYNNVIGYINTHVKMYKRYPDFQDAVNFVKTISKKKTMKNQTSFAYLEAKGKSKVWNAYAEHFAGEEIMEEGFNSYSGYVYIALEDGIQICSCLGQSVEYCIFNKDDEEEFFQSYEELMEYLENS
jgi:hypothetical protein